MEVKPGGYNKAIRRKCLDCSGGSQMEVRECVAISCPLWPYRFGKDRKTSLRGGFYTEEELRNSEVAQKELGY